MGVKLVLKPRRHYGISVGVKWYILVRLWVKVFVSQGLIQAETKVSRRASTRNKDNKGNNILKIKLKLFYMVSFLSM